MVFAPTSAPPFGCPPPGCPSTFWCASVLVATGGSHAGTRCDEAHDEGGSARISAPENPTDGPSVPIDPLLRRMSSTSLVKHRHRRMLAAAMMTIATLAAAFL